MSTDILTERAKRRRWLKISPAFRTPLAITGVSIALIWLVIAIFAPIIAPYDPLAQAFERLQPPSAEHLFGTDAVGRDVLSRVISGARISMPLALSLVVASMVVGGTLGAIAGYFGKAVDEVIMRIADLVFAFPTIILAMVITAALGPSLTNAVIAMLIVSWPAYARVTRSLVLSARTQEYVIAGRLLGNGPFTSLRRDILPNVLSPVFVLAMLDVGTAILLLAGLSFLGLGATPPTPDWGAMVSDGVQQFSSWWIAAFPGLAIFTVVMAFNFIGDSLRDSLDPRAQDAVQGRAM
ncbi:putative D,D-dipeptide transport system permease protein DdpC [Leucobacter aridicollis]|uniref:Peptide/nickel transport system permease protein n=1 Tax=Leucobacter aridicollis TaxID=283878 RepID=A0A852R9J8_9MICO|nr:ABC transporter permease [Leucobacter aridicollis]MBL3683331.1 ABC transporter permease [Leucobacter aridicollis]MCS3429392.1 peptide/nickel transport system permease protein [Leucobacter aridicollis]NYD25570.1 peptide/nickel transport system permease protein [Leucobacter aridicollis]